jgi:penicillin-insensitive murein DD-endopeptidase
MIGTVFLVSTLAVLWGNSVARAFESSAPSRSIGTPADGRLEHGKRLPTAGANFVAYSRVGALLGRNSVHATVRDVVLEAYHEVAETRPDVRFVYGETGWPSGGRFRPHRTHRNGLSVDFMVPVRTTSGRSVPLPTWPWTRFGYDLEFGADGRHAKLRIDFDAIAAHLAALQKAAERHGLSIQVVIFAPELEALLRADSKRRALVGDLPFMRGQPWIRHDEHYHVDFSNPRGSAARPDEVAPAVTGEATSSPS